jgi:hypothetical protein
MVGRVTFHRPAADSSALIRKTASKKKSIAKKDLARIFGIELEAPAPAKKLSRRAAEQKAPQGVGLEKPVPAGKPSGRAHPAKPADTRPSIKVNSVKQELSKKRSPSKKT